MVRLLVLAIAILYHLKIAVGLSGQWLLSTTEYKGLHAMFVVFNVFLQTVDLLMLLFIQKPTVAIAQVPQ